MTKRNTPTDEFEAAPVKTVKGRDIPENVIQLVACEIATGPNQETIIARSPFNPVTYPESILLDKVHMNPGKPEAVRRVRHAGYVTRTVGQEKARLAAKYGPKVVEELFPGRRPDMERWNELDAPRPGLKCHSGDFVNTASEDEDVNPDEQSEAEAEAKQVAEAAKDEPAKTEPAKATSKPKAKPQPIEPDPAD